MQNDNLSIKAIVETPVASSELTNAVTAYLSKQTSKEFILNLIGLNGRETLKKITADFRKGIRGNSLRIFRLIIYD
ncbi:MAG TPA: hypothetical protein VEC36_07490 [Patescibacteria group bacterium]|nr:hypothetical protein [Patescibacteria group bacterium]